jgi:tryptophan halogenase
VLGGGTAGWLSALALQRAFADLQITVVYSPTKPVIGVGESTTALFPQFLHGSLGLEREEFFHKVRPSWKLGIRFLWGDPSDSHFNYPFDQCMNRQTPPLSRMPPYYCMDDWINASRYSAMMDAELAPCVMTSDNQLAMDESCGYHIENRAFIDYLREKANASNIDQIAAEFTGAARGPSGQLAALRLSDGRELTADLFVDCSGFRSLLLGGELQTPFDSYKSSLPCDSTLVGTWQRDDRVLPYTTAETMNNGWCWRIDFPHHVSRGYVYASDFCDEETAQAEFRDKNPQLDERLQSIRFRSGRYREFWVNNVVALGNSAGFVEPLEATALHVLVEQIRLLCRMLAEGQRSMIPAMRAAGNQRFRLLWDEVRDFLAVHFRFNRRVDSPFWRWCRENVDLAGAADLVRYFQAAGPSTLCGGMLPSGRIFGYDGFMTLLVGQRVATEFQLQLTDDDRQRWNQHRQRVLREVSRALPMDEALRHIYGNAR